MFHLNHPNLMNTGLVLFAITVRFHGPTRVFASIITFFISSRLSYILKPLIGRYPGASCPLQLALYIALPAHSCPVL